MADEQTKNPLETVAEILCSHYYSAFSVPARHSLRDAILESAREVHGLERTRAYANFAQEDMRERGLSYTNSEHRARYHLDSVNAPAEPDRLSPEHIAKSLRSRGVRA